MVLKKKVDMVISENMGLSIFAHPPGSPTGGCFKDHLGAKGRETKATHLPVVLVRFW